MFKKSLDTKFIHDIKKLGSWIWGEPHKILKWLLVTFHVNCMLTLVDEELANYFEFLVWHSHLLYWTMFSSCPIHLTYNTKFLQILQNFVKHHSYGCIVTFTLLPCAVVCTMYEHSISLLELFYQHISLSLCVILGLHISLTALNFGSMLGTLTYEQ